MKLTPNINQYHGNSSLLFQFILSEYLKVAEELKKNKSFEKAIHSISGSTLATMRIFSWTLDTSPVSKLKDYCALFHLEKDFPKKDRDAAKRLSFELWELGLETLELIEEKKSPKKLMAEIEATAEKLGKTLVRLLAHFAEDENVLYFVLRHYSQLTEAVNTKKIAPLLKQQKEQIAKSYRKRKFDSLVPNIEELFTQL